MAPPPQRGDLIEVFWPIDDCYYRGVVTAVDDKVHRVEYADGDVETLNLEMERWRCVARDVTYLGNLLLSAATKSEEVRSPVSIMQISGNQDIAAMSLIAQHAVHWLRDPSRRASVPVSALIKAQWMRLCGDLCMSYIEGALAILPTSPTLHPRYLSWLHEHSQNLDPFRCIYDHWSPAVDDNEWGIEKGIMERLKSCFSLALFQITDTRNVGVRRRAEIICVAARKCMS